MSAIPALYARYPSISAKASASSIDMYETEYPKLKKSHIAIAEPIGTVILS
jgi:hypothetical protein